MSAQVIAALRRRANEEDRQAISAQHEDPPKLEAALIHLLIAQALRDVADDAEGHPGKPAGAEPQDSLDWE